MLSLPAANKAMSQRTLDERIAIAWHHVNADPKSHDKLKARCNERHPLLAGMPQRITIFRFVRAKATDPWLFESRDEMDEDEFYKFGDPKDWK